MSLNVGEASWHCDDVSSFSPQFVTIVFKIMSLRCHWSRQICTFCHNSHQKCFFSCHNSFQIMSLLCHKTFLMSQIKILLCHRLPFSRKIILSDQTTSHTFLLSPQNFLSLFVSFRFWIDYFLSCLSCVVRQEKTILTLFRNSQFFPLTSGLLFWEAALTVFVFGRHSNCLIHCIGGCAAAASILTMHRNQYNNVCVTMSNI